MSDAEKRKKILESAWLHYNSLHKLSRCLWYAYESQIGNLLQWYPGVGRSSPNSSTYIKKIYKHDSNKVNNKQKKKIVSCNYTNQNVPYMIWHKYLLLDFCSQSWSIWHLALQSLLWNPDLSDRVIFIISCKLIAVSRRLVMQTLLEHSKTKQTPFLSFSQNSNLQPFAWKLTQVSNYLLHQSYQISNQ